MAVDTSKRSLSNPKFYTFSVVALLGIRVYINFMLPLMDKTEARYAEIARIMAETNNYLTPQIDYNIPFWAKPPLSTWMSALSIEVFGATEFAVRVPSLLISIILLFLVGKYASKQGLPFFLPGLILLTIPEFLLHAGVVSTDMSLTFSVALVMLSFWEVLQGAKRSLWPYIFFVGIALGFLAKGPIILILTIPPLFLWSLINGEVQKVLSSFPWFTGLLIVSFISFPWYFFAEKATPGFIDYFIVGEHFQRFFDSEWSGDKYGFPKSQPLGIIWLFLVLFALPWVIVCCIKIWKNRYTIMKNRWLSFLVLWLLWTPFFFTFSSSLIHPYILPVMVPIALLIAHWWDSIKLQKSFVYLSLSIPLLSLLILVYGVKSSDLEYYSKTDKYFMESLNNHKSPMYHLNKKSYSSQFYTDGNIRGITNEKLDSLLLVSKPFYILISHRDTTALGKQFLQRFEMKKANKFKGLYIKP